MRVEVALQGGQNDLGLKRYVGLRFMSVLDELERHVEVVTVRLDARAAASDAGVTQRCRVVARLTSGEQVAIEHVDAGTHASIDAAAEMLAPLVKLAAAHATRGRRPVLRVGARLDAGARARLQRATRVSDRR